MNKGNLTSPTSQELNNRITPSSKGFFENNILDDIRSMPIGLQSALKTYLDEHIRNPHIRIPRTAMAERIGCHPNHVSRINTQLVERGYIYRWQPGGESNVTKLEAKITEPSTMKKIRYLFKMFVFFSTSYIASTIASQPRVTHLTLKDNGASEFRHQSRDCFVPNFYKNCTGTNIVLSNNIAAQDLYLSDNTWLYCSEKGEPNKRMTDDEAHEIFGAKKERVALMHFTQEQLEELSQYSKEALSYATKMLTKDMAAGKAITNQFAYFKSICRGFKEKNPQTRQVKPTTRPTTGAQSIYKHEEREQESDYEFARNLEFKLHERRNDETLHKAVFRVENPKWNRITLEEQQQIMADIHIDCDCRKLVDRSLHEPPIVKNPDTKNWNEMIITSQPMAITPVTQDELGLVSDNIPDFMSEQYVGEEYGEFEEIID